MTASFLCPSKDGKKTENCILIFKNHKFLYIIHVVFVVLLHVFASFMCVDAVYHNNYSAGLFTLFHLCRSLLQAFFPWAGILSFNLNLFGKAKGT